MKYKTEIVGLNVIVSKNKNQKNLYIRVVPPDGEVRVSVPYNCPDEEIRFIIIKNISQIKAARERIIAQARRDKREYLSGESFYLWGKAYTLEVVEGFKSCNVRQDGDRIILEAPEASTLEKREKAIIEWYREEMKKSLPDIIDKCEESTDLKASEYRIKNMKTRWGTCNIQKKRVWLSLQLAKKPIECLEYVLIHELVHLLEKGHNDRFYVLVEKFYPNWKEARKLLREMPLD